MKQILLVIAAIILTSTNSSAQTGGSYRNGVSFRQSAYYNGWGIIPSQSYDARSGWNRQGQFNYRNGYQSYGFYNYPLRYGNTYDYSTQLWYQRQMQLIEKGW